MSELELNAPQLPPGEAAVRLFRDIGRLEDGELQERLHRLDSVGRGVEAGFIAHLAEFDARGLYKKLGYGSLFTYCRDVYGYSESRAYKRIHAARAVRRFPIILERLASGRLHMTAVSVLAPHLTEENLLRVIDSAEKRTKYELERLVASLAPREDMKDVVMRLPSRSEEPITAPPPPGAPEPAAQAEEPSLTAVRPDTPSKMPACTPLPSRPDKVIPLSPERIYFGFTGSSALREKLERVKDLVWHKEPRGRLGVLFEKIVDDFLRRKDPLSRRVPPRRVRAPKRSASRARRIPATVRREVWNRDGGVCAFRGTDGHRCAERRGLEVDHVVAYSRGGSSTDPENLRLLCRSHNQWVAREAGLPRPDACRRPPAEGTPP